MAERRSITVDILYGDHDGGQRTISRFGLFPLPEGPGWTTAVARHWNLDRPDPRRDGGLAGALSRSGRRRRRGGSPPAG